MKDFHRISSSLLIAIAVLLLASLFVLSERVESSAIQDLINSDDNDLSAFLKREAIALEQHDARHLQDLGTRRDRQFGERCGNRNACGEGLDCVNAAIGNRCLPNQCLQEQFSSNTVMSSFDVDRMKANLYETAGYSEEEIFAAMAETGNNPRKFLESNEFLALKDAFDAQVEPMIAMEQISRACIDPRNTTVNGTVSYTGLHIEVRTRMKFMFGFLLFLLLAPRLTCFLSTFLHSLVPFWIYSSTTL